MTTRQAAFFRGKVSHGSTGPLSKGFSSITHNQIPFYKFSKFILNGNKESLHLQHQAKSNHFCSGPQTQGLSQQLSKQPLKWELSKNAFKKLTY